MESLNILVCWVMCYASVSDTDDFFQTCVYYKPVLVLVLFLCALLQMPALW